jgi:16S rRNA (cytidine1402-2'-O)-methyltransferase
MAEKGSLYLLPSPLGEDALYSIPSYLSRSVEPLEHFIVERARTARRFIRALCPAKDLSRLSMVELNEHTPPEALPDMLAPALKGHDIGLLSEAGCPAIADPGAEIVALAHRHDIEVKPLVGPSALLLALMASGMNGQSFCFNGYLPAKRPQLERELTRLEQRSTAARQTQIFIEAPYRNHLLMQTALKVLRPQTLLCVAVDLTLPAQWIKTRTAAQWRRFPPPDLHKRPAVFLMLTTT